MKKKLISLLLVCTLVLGMIPGAALAADTGSPFKDVKTTDWFFDAVQYAYDHDLMSGTGNNNFSPSETTTRGMMVTILHNMEGKPAAGRPDFTDVLAGEWYAAPVAWASAHGIVSGYGNGKFGPNDPITREQMVTILYQYARYKNYELTVTGDISTFDDYDKTSAYAVTPFNWAIGKDLIAGVGNNLLDPTGNAERSHIAAIMKSFCEKVAENQSTEEPSISQDSKQEAIEDYNVVSEEINKIESSYLNQDGCIAFEDVPEVLEEVKRYASQLKNQGVISRYDVNDSAISMKIGGWLGLIYVPPVKDMLTGSQNAVEIRTFEPFSGEWETYLSYLFAGIKGADEAAEQLEATFPERFTFQKNYDSEEVSVETLKNIPKNSIIFWFGHGANDPRLGPVLFLGTKKNDESTCLRYAEEMENDALLINPKGEFYVTYIFFEKYLPKGSLEGSLIYLGACWSFADRRLAESIFVDQKAKAILGNTKAVNTVYNFKMMYTFAEGLTKKKSDGSYYTLAQALSYAKSEHGDKDPLSPLVGGMNSEVQLLCSNADLPILDFFGPELSGKIIDKDSQMGISDAKVSIYLGSELLQTKTTDSNGNFVSDGNAFEMNETNLAKLKLVIEKEGYLSLTTPVSMVSGNPDNDLKWDLGVFELTPIKITPASITGVVRRDLDLNSLSGVSVYLNCLFGASGENIGATAITDKEGKFSIEVPDNATALTSLRFEKEGYEGYTYPLPSNADTSVDVGVIRLKSKPIEIFTASISGTVSDASSNQAIENATVELYNGESKVSTETTNSGGSFYAAILTPGTYSIRVTKSGYQSYETTLTVENGKNSQIEISLVPVSSEKVVYVSNAEQFNAIRNDLDAHYILTSDINLSGYSTWKPIGTTQKPFTGVLDGDGHTITGMKITSFDLSEEIESKGSTAYCGAALFGTVNSGGVIQNIAIQNASIYCDSGYVSTCYALLVGKLFGESKVDNCIVSGSIDLSSPGCYVGGVVSYATDSEIVNSRSNTNIELYAQLNNNASSFAGGVVGYSYSGSGSVRHCRNEGNILMNIEALGWAASIGVSESTGVGGVVGFGLAEDSCNTASRLTLSGNVSTGECGRISGIRLNGRNVNCVSYSKTLVNGSQVSSSDASSIHGRDISSLQSLDEWYNQ